MSNGQKTPIAHRALVARQESLERLSKIIRNGSSQAVFLMAGPGIGKTSLVDALAERLQGEMNIVQVHGSSALAAVPFGVLTPYTAELTAEESDSPVAVLRSMWTYFEKLKAGKSVPVLVVVDDAHHLDESSAGILADVISAGWAAVVAAARTRPGLPQPLDQLWYDGLAERIDLRPLSREQTEDVLAHVLDGTIPADTVDAIWSSSGGNPRILDALLYDAAETGILSKRNGIWVLLGPLPADGPQLTAVVTKDYFRRARQEQEAIKLVALAGPVGRKVIEDICGATVVRSLMDQQILVEIPGVPAELRLWNHLYAETIRNTLSVSRSLQLLEVVSLHRNNSLLHGEGMMRAVEWACECGLQVADAERLQAAKEALKRYRNESAYAIAAKVQDPALVHLASAAKARALYNEGRYGEAADLLDNCWYPLSRTPEGTAVLLLRAAAHQGCGRSLETLLQETRELLEEPADGDHLPEQLLLVARFLQAGSAVDAVALAAAVEEAAAGQAKPEEDAVRAVGEALFSHALAAAGRAAEGLDHALAAASKLRPQEDSLFFFPQFVLCRLVLTYLAMGEWESAERELDNHAAEHALGAATFSGSLQVLRGYSLLRQGRMERAYQMLLPAVEALRLHDPLQLFRFSSALGAYTAARLGDAAQARRLEQDFADAVRGVPALELLAAAYGAAAAEYQSRDGRGLAALHSLATAPEAQDRAGTRLEVLTLCWDLGDPSILPAVRALAQTVEGRWAQAMSLLASRWEDIDGDALMEAAGSLEKSGFLNLAREAYARASSLLEQAGEKRRSRQAVTLREKCDHELGERFREGRFITAAPTVHLTRREQDIVGLAIQGLTDREIAQRLMVSVRTVEGHLYRTYVKLGVRSRDELESALPR